MQMAVCITDDQQTTKIKALKMQKEHKKRNHITGPVEVIFNWLGQHRKGSGGTARISNWGYNAIERS